VFVALPAASRAIRDVGRRIAEIRGERDWSQARLAEELGIALQNLQRMEQGRQNFTVRTLVRVAQKLGCEPRELWEPPATTRPRRGRPKKESALSSERRVSKSKSK